MSLLPYVVAEFGLEDMSDSSLTTLEEIIESHDYTDLVVSSYPPEYGKHSYMIATMMTKSGKTIQYRIGSRGGKEKLKGED